MMKQRDNKFSVTWRGKNFILDMQLAANLKELGDALQRLTNVKPDTMRLVVPMSKGSKLFYPFSDDHSHLALEAAYILEGKSIRMMGVPANEVDELLQNSRVDHRIAGFDEEEKRLRRRISDGKNSLPKLPQGTYIFSEFRTLDIPGKELNPPAAEALKLMHRLASDPGIVAIMTQHHWRVGIMSEMAPVGYVGVSPKCILGFNKNHGEEISLRLRTDDLNGFRKYESIKKTLLHELAHMVYSEHDTNFYALDKQLNEEAATLDWTRAKGYKLSGVRHLLYSGGGLTSHISSSQKLGGKASAFSNAVASSAAAAYRRFANSSNNTLGMLDMNEESDSDCSGFICQEPDSMHIEGKTETSITDTGLVQKFSNVHDAPHNEFEPVLDDSEGGEAMVYDPCTHSSGNGKTTAPHADHSEVTAVPILTTKASDELASKNLCVPMKDGIMAGPELLGETEGLLNLNKLKVVSLEPDPDASGLRKNNGDYKDVLKPDFDKDLHMKDETQPALLVKSCSEPNPDDSQASTVVQSELDPDDDIIVVGRNLSKGQADEPDPDDMELQRIQDPVTTICGRLQKAVEMLRSELNPSVATSILQTILRILQNAIEHPDELKFRKLRKANPIIQRNIVSHRAAMEILHLIGFSEEVLVDGLGNGETYLILKRKDPGLLWLAKTSLESSIA